jgi:hypothetical protein
MCSCIAAFTSIKTTLRSLRSGAKWLNTAPQLPSPRIVFAIIQACDLEGRAIKKLAEIWKHDIEAAWVVRLRHGNFEVSKIAIVPTGHALLIKLQSVT